jgi:hypothetical protein
VNLTPCLRQAGKDAEARKMKEQKKMLLPESLRESTNPVNAPLQEFLKTILRRYDFAQS